MASAKDQKVLKSVPLGPPSKGQKLSGRGLSLSGQYMVYGDDDRMQHVADLVEQGSQDGYIRELAINILKQYSVPEKAELQECKAIFDWTKDHITYRKDVFCRDSYHTAPRIVQLGAADCDDFVILIDSLLASVGYPIGARIISTKKERPFHHIYALVGLPSGRPVRWYPMDGTVRRLGFGQEAKFAKKRDYIFVCDRSV